MKPGPIFAMLAILGLSMWIMLKTSPSKEETPDAAQIELVVASNKLKVEQRPSQSNAGEYEFRFRNWPRDWPEKGEGWFTQSEYNAIIMKNADTKGRSPILQACNVTSYPNLAWVALGLGGQLVFAGRMIIQWLASEKKRQSVVPPAFWYMSLAGGLCLTAYFVWRHDIVGVLGQAMGLVVYVRNIRLLMLHRPGGRRAPDAVPVAS